MSDKTTQAAKEAAHALKFPALALVNNQPRASSARVAADFGKNHKDVLRQIRQITANCPESFHGRNFAPVVDIIERPDGSKIEVPAYSLTRDGFTLLAMGFTGPKALQFKVAYIEAFNRMEAELAGGPSRPTLDGPSTTQTRKPLTNLVNTWVSRAPISYRDAWHQVKGLFQIEEAKDLTLAQVREACAWVQERIDDLGSAHNLLEWPKRGILPLDDETELVSAEDYQKFKTMFAAYSTAFNNLYGLVRGMAQIAASANSAFSTLNLGRDDEEMAEIIKWLSAALDTERYDALGFHGNIFQDIKFTVRQYRAAVEYFYRIQKKKAA